MRVKLIIALCAVFLCKLTVAQTGNYFEKYYGQVSSHQHIHSQTIRLSNGNYVQVGTADLSSDINAPVDRTIYIVYTDGSGVVQSGINKNVFIQDAQETYLKLECYSVTETEQSDIVAITGKAYINSGSEDIFVATFDLSTGTIANFITYDLNGTSATEQGNKIIYYNSALYVTGFSTITVSGTTNKRCFLLKSDIYFSAVSANFITYLPNPGADLDLEGLSLVYDGVVKNNIVVVGSVTGSQNDLRDVIPNSTSGHKYTFLATFDQNTVQLLDLNFYFLTGVPYVPNQSQAEQVVFRNIKLDISGCNHSVFGYILCGRAEWAGQNYFTVIKIDPATGMLLWHTILQTGSTTHSDAYDVAMECGPGGTQADHYVAVGEYVESGKTYTMMQMIAAGNTVNAQGHPALAHPAMIWGGQNNSYDDGHSVWTSITSPNGVQNFTFNIFGTSDIYGDKDFKFIKSNYVDMGVPTYPGYTCNQSTVNYDDPEADFPFVKPEFGDNYPGSYTPQYTFSYVSNNDALWCDDETPAEHSPFMSAGHNEVKKGISIYPNPANNRITFSEAVNGYTIYDQLGKQVTTSTSLSGTDINIEKLPRGIYLIHYWKGEQKVTQKIVKM